VVPSKRERMKAFEPAMIGIASFLGFSKKQHANTFYCDELRISA